MQHPRHKPCGRVAGPRVFRTGKGKPCRRRNIGEDRHNRNATRAQARKGITDWAAVAQLDQDTPATTPRDPVKDGQRLRLIHHIAH